MQPKIPTPASKVSLDSSGMASVDPESLLGTQSRTATFRPEDTPADRVELPAPEAVGRYEIRSLLGRGAFGAVYLGWDPQLKRQVAIKVPRLAAENTAEQIEAFLEEARRAVQLERHQGIVPVYDVGRDGDLCYIVSQYIEGGTLSQLLKEGPVPVEKAVKLAATLADIVHFAHRQGWVHRDIKPSNILLDAEGNPYLADFGLTSRLDDLRSAHGPPNGTPNYMAPELAREALLQIRRQAGPTSLRPDQRSDVYSLGVVLYQLLTGGLPFEGENLTALFDLVLHSDPVPPRLAGAKISARLEEVCLKALAKEPSARYRTAADLHDDLQIVAMSLAVPDSRIKIDDRALWGLTPPRLAAVIGAGVLLLAITVAVIVAANNFWRKPVDHTSPTGDTNVALLHKSAKMEAPSPPTLAPQAAHDRRILIQELRDILREDARAGEDRFGGTAKRETPRTMMADRPPAGVGFAPAAVTETAKSQEELALQRDLQAARDEKDVDREYSLLMKASNKLVESGHAKEAEQAARRMAEIAVRDDAKRPFAYGQLGLAQSALGEYEEALASHQQSLAAFREIYNVVKVRKDARAKADLSHVSRMVGLTLNRIGNVNKQLKNYDDADKAFNEAREVLSPFDDRKGELTTVLMNQGSLYSVRGDHTEAQKTLEQALHFAEEQKDVATQAEVLVNLGNAQSRNGGDAKAIESYTRADALLPETASYDVRSRLLYNWIMSLLAEERLDEAERQVARLREFARPDDPLAQRILEAAEPLLKDARKGEKK